jgi:hypothetical protein
VSINNQFTIHHRLFRFNVLRAAQAVCPQSETIISLGGITNLFGVSLGSRDLDDDNMELTIEERSSVLQEVYERNPNLKCRGLGYATLTAYTTDDGVWILQGNKDNHDKYETVMTQNATLSYEDAIKMAGGTFFEHCKYFYLTTAHIQIFML